ncbi:hypothetical protein [Neobacillus kokaensis]|uniref:ECF-type sigma factor negative effector n=1 Tax=Neobacillus kokaensis TaxID=2759023 RepID=A0ABQ3N2A9_9BACI|nr:hypothetical protein [Neobacillus kokaensis]GHH99083.1 hypothetical protein AM1BK_26260 [Neobacillus kokaensis]
MKNTPEEQWEILKQVTSTKAEKFAIREKIYRTIQNAPSQTSSVWTHRWKNALASCILIFIFAGFIVQMVHEKPQFKTAEPYKLDAQLFNWELDQVYSEKTGEELALYKNNESNQVGTVKEVSEQEKNNIIASKSMHINTELEHFPYATYMYIEHVKMMDVALRYYFFIPLTKEKWLEFSFDYPKLEHAEILQAMSTLKIKGKTPYNHDGPLYVTHGYGSMLFPTDLKPIYISPEKEVYHWEGASFKAYQDYLKKITSGTGGWKEQSGNNSSYTFISGNENEIVTITLKDKELTYEFTYPNRDDQ